MLTVEQATERFKDFPLKFSSYYKYTFVFSGERDGVNILAQFGRDSGDIYRYSVDAKQAIELGDIKANWHFVNIKENGQEIFKYEDWM